MSDLKILWGDLHDNVGQTDTPSATPLQAMEFARSHLDFYAPAYYTAQQRHITTKDGRTFEGKPAAMEVETWKSDEKLAREWAHIEELTRKFHEPGRFVTFPCWEWHGNGVSGDHNVVYRREGGKIYAMPTLAELYDKLRGQEALAIPHHIGYRVGARGKDWSVHDDKLSPFAELFSVHGCSETDEEWIGLRINPKMGPGVGGNTYQDALDRGFHVGAICSPDGDGSFPGRFNWGVMACLAPELTRDALWRAFNQRHVYGVTGDRILLDFHVNGAVMGDQIKTSGKRRIDVAVEGVGEIDRIELLRDGRVIYTQSHQGAWELPGGAGRARFKCRVEAGWGQFAREIGPQPSRRWKGKLSLSGSGRVISATPCFVSGDQTLPAVKASEATFSIVAPQLDAAYARKLNQNAFVFEIEAAMNDQLRLEMDGLETTASVASLCRHSRMLADIEAAERMLLQIYDVKPYFDVRPRFIELLAQRVKLHRLVPQAAYTCSFSIEDDTPLQGEHHYRIRVEQRNGQRAWSSPIWVSQSKGVGG